MGLCFDVVVLWQVINFTDELAAPQVDVHECHDDMQASDGTECSEINVEGKLARFLLVAVVAIRVVAIDEERNYVLQRSNTEKRITKEEIHRQIGAIRDFG